MNKTKEIELILQLCKVHSYDPEKIRSLIKDNIDYPYVLGQLMYNRTGGAAYNILNECNLLSRVNREVRNSLSLVYEYNCIRQDSFKQAIDYLGTILNEVDFAYALLKGAWLVNIYGKGIRTSNDIDILIEQSNITKLTTILKLNGFRQGTVKNNKFIEATRYEIIFSRINRGETVPFIKEINLPFLKYIEIDVNFSLDYKSPKDNSYLVREFLNNTERNIITEHSTLRSLTEVYFFIHLCLHLYKEATVINWVKMGRDVSLYKYMDIGVFVDRFFNKQFIEKFISLVKKIGMEKECYYVLFYTKILLGSNNSLDYVLDSIKPKDISYMNQIVDAENKKLYAFDCQYLNWVFSNNKVEWLNEINDG